jgi:uncharacterized membrane protein YbhN (UPF0104 family)
MPPRLVDRFALAATVFIFAAAVVVLVRQFADVSLHEVLARLAAMPGHQIVAALALTAANYLCLTGYDFLALRYIGRRVRFRDTVFASFTAFAISNNIGFQLFSGASIRYRIYSSFGLPATDIGKLVTFCAIAYALGIVTVGALLALTEPDAIGALLHLPRFVILIAGLGLLAVSAAYLATAARCRSIGIGRYALKLPSPAIALTQVALASVDAALAGSVMYVLLPPDMAVTYHYFLGVYLVAATVSVLSPVPGGLGVFETAITIMMAPTSKAAALGVFAAYRAIYFILPLAIALIGFALHEIGGSRRAWSRS